MQILSVHLKNIKSHRDTELSFSSGINVLSGPNGVGKSTIFEAIGYALFGVDAKDFVSNVDRFLSIGAKRGEISVTFRTDNGETYRVNRTVGPGAKWLLARENGGGFEVEDHARIEETETRIAGLLGLDNGRSLAEQFKLVIGPFQNDFLGPFIIKQPIKRQEAFDEILGIDAWRKTYKGTSGLLSAVQERIKVLTVEVTAKQEQLAVLPDKEAELSSIRNEQATKEGSLKEKTDSLRHAEKLLGDLDKREKAISAVQTEVQVLIGRITEGDEKIATQRVRVEEAGKAQKAVEGARPGKDAYDKAESQLKELRKREQQRRLVEQESNSLDKDVLRLTQGLEHERGEVEKTASQLSEDVRRLAEARQGMQADRKVVDTAAGLADLLQESDRLKAMRSLLGGRRIALLEGKDKLAEGACPFFREQCRNIAGTAPRDVFTGRTEELDRQMTELDRCIELLSGQVQDARKAEQELNALKIRLQELDKQIVTLEERRTRNQERAANLDRLAAQQVEAVRKATTRKADLQPFAELDEEIERTEKERSRFQAAHDAFNAHQKDAIDHANRLQLLEKMLKLMVELKQGRNTKEAELTMLREAYRPELHQNARAEKDRLVAEVATLRSQIEEMGRNHQRLDAEIALLQRIKTELEAKLAEIKVFEEKEKLVKYLRNQVFKNVSTQLSERFREEITLHADRIYRTIADSDEELYWGDNYQIILRDMQDGAIRERSDDQLSGGQMMSAVVALRLALLQTIGARIAFFDEPTSSLDAARRENLAHAFRAIDVGREEVTEHWYDQLFLVSHDVAFTEITDKIIEL
ncbi:MAG: SMC family ATPase [Deltaproteobacteria bacterium]|nr:SMC family ATPase [Deltaproteobacteria bacterium]